MDGAASAPFSVVALAPQTEKPVRLAAHGFSRCIRASWYALDKRLDAAVISSPAL
jgi:hypothetical protein